VALTSLLKCGKKKTRRGEKKKGELKKKKNLLLVLFIPSLMYTMKMKFFNEL
jgi:hypothetical protein